MNADQLRPTPFTGLFAATNAADTDPEKILVCIGYSPSQQQA